MAVFNNLHDTIIYASKILKNILNDIHINESDVQSFYANGDGYVVRRICIPDDFKKYIKNGKLTRVIKFSDNEFKRIIIESLTLSSLDGISVNRDFVSKNIINNYDNVRTSFLNNRVTDDTIDNILTIFKLTQVNYTNKYLEFITTCDLTRRTIHICANGNTFAVVCFKISYLEQRGGISVISAPSANNENHSLLIDSDFLNAKKNVITDYKTLKTFVDKNPNELLNALKFKDNGKSTINFLADKIYNDVCSGNCLHLMSTKFNDIDHFVVCNYRDYDILNFRNNKYDKFHMNVQYKNNVFYISDSR